MNDLVVHPATEQALTGFTKSPSHALLLLGPAGTGKTALARILAGQLLDVEPDKLANYPYFMLVTPPESRTISIDDIRSLIHFLTLRTTGSSDIARVIVIEHAQAMTIQAQNALLKTIEEPPADTILLLTAPSELGILPTILSRVRKLSIRLPDTEATTVHFQKAGYSSASIQKALAMSDGLPGLTAALLAGDVSHPLVAATASARIILQASPYERLALVDDMAAHREMWMDILFMLGRMADVSLRKSNASAETTTRWQRVLAACHTAQSQTLASAQLKLVVLNFMLAV